MHLFRYIHNYCIKCMFVYTLHRNVLLIYIYILSFSPNADQNSCSKGYSVSNCQVCHYSSDLQSFSCGLDCIDVNGEYDDTCIRNWGVCLRRSYLPIFRSVRFL